jgi:hypothetical protein
VDALLKAVAMWLRLAGERDQMSRNLLAAESRVNPHLTADRQVGAVAAVEDVRRRMRLVEDGIEEAQALCRDALAACQEAVGRGRLSA